MRGFPIRTATGGGLCALLLALCLTAAPAAAQDDPAAAASDSLAAGAAADSLEAAPGSLDAERLAYLAGAAAAASNDPSETPLIGSWARKPGVSVKAEMRKVLYAAEFGNEFSLRDEGVLTNDLTISRDDYRQQDKTVDKRDGTLNYRSGKDGAFQGGLNMMWNWNEDRVINKSGVENLTKRDFKSATAKLDRDAFEMAGLEHTVAMSGAMSDQKAEMQGKRNDISEANLSGNIHSVYEPSPDFVVQTHAGAITKSGERALGEQTNPSSADGDTLKMSADYARGRLNGDFIISRTSFSKKYLDYNRNSNGIIDTIGVAQKIVDELETNDAVTLDWNNELNLGRLQLKAELGRTMSESDFRASGVGRKKNHEDNARFNLGLRMTARDSINLDYAYRFKWDDQTYKNQPESRGRQVAKDRSLRLVWDHELFEGTTVKNTWSTGLNQSTAEKAFNQNDRDRLDFSYNVSMRKNWSGGQNADLSFDYERTESISLRESRSGNNAIKETYEISPGYKIPLFEGFTLNQSFSVWIQYTDYVYSHLESINKTDNYNKRAVMNTQVTYKPNSRVTVSVRHDNNIKLNSNKSRTDAAGGDYYSRDTKQDISKVDLSITWRVNDWMKLEGTTLTQRDLKETYGDRANLSERYTGDVAIGGSIDRRFANGQLKIAVMKNFAHGPNVQPTAQEFWDADIQIDWRF